MAIYCRVYPPYQNYTHIPKGIRVYEYRRLSRAFDLGSLFCVFSLPFPTVLMEPDIRGDVGKTKKPFQS